MQTLRQAAAIKPEPVEETVTNETPKSGFMHNLKTMLADSDDISALSTKRVLACLAFVCCVIAFFVDLFSNYNISPNLFDAMMWIAIAGMGFTGIEKFAPKK